MRVIVCGGRNFTGRAAVYRELDALLRENRTLTVVQGGAPGADDLALAWCMNPGVMGSIEPITYLASWDLYGNAAGPRRNQEMADAGADLCIAFPGGRGTEDMVRRATRAGIPVRRVA
ncbi:MAG TPA: DUF2493 domain-containing protein [Acidimicrobiales bacterium]|nr:DUF2493 domain-containing protein [Acidimicrobiales bacterium]